MSSSGRKHRDDEPSSFDCIEENLWLGNLSSANNLEIIRTRHITHILTIDTWPLPRRVTELKTVKTKSIPVSDLPTEDLISEFQSAYDFIEEGVKEGSVMVHCHQGVSRSATIVLAYLMKKRKITFEEALEMTKSKRRIVQPNQGFTAQLKLYQAMEYKIDMTNKQYRIFRLYIAADRFRTAKSLPESCSDVVKPDPSLETALPDSRVYRCKKCRRIVAGESNIIPHLPKVKYTWRDLRYTSEESKKYFCQKIFFIEPMTWMKSVISSLAGKLYCPKCQTKLGSYCWSMGCLCPCGTKVSPAFYLVPSKVDKEELVPVKVIKEEYMPLKVAKEEIVQSE